MTILRLLMLPLDSNAALSSTWVSTRDISPQLVTPAPLPAWLPRASLVSMVRNAPLFWFSQKSCNLTNSLVAPFNASALRQLPRV